MDIARRVVDAFAPLYLDGAVASESDRRIATMFANWFTDPDGGRTMLLLAVPDIGSAEHATFDAGDFSGKILASGLLNDFDKCLREQPRRVLCHLGLALVIYREKVLGRHASKRRHPIRVHFTGIMPELALNSLKSSLVGKLVRISGYVVRVSTIQPLVTRASFECPKCGTLFARHFKDGNYESPSKCANNRCRAKSFELRRGTALTEDLQRLKVQEIDNSMADAGRVPRTVEVELTGSALVDKCIPGDLVTIVGIVSSINADHAAGRSGRRATSNSLFLLYITANSLCTGHPANAPLLRRTDGACDTEDSLTSSSSPESGSPGAFTGEDLHVIQNIADSSEVFSWLVNSVCPSIFGHERVKVGIALGLFGGSKVNELSGGGKRERWECAFCLILLSCRFAVLNVPSLCSIFAPSCLILPSAAKKHLACLLACHCGSLPVRADVHILVVGDPGLGKSQILRAAAQVSPRGVYISANTTTVSGLTVSVSRETGGGGDVNLEAGALVLADQGLCVIDEFDKIGCDHHCLLEGMEQQQVSVAKAGVVATLSARCSILAAANPVGGHYDCSKSIVENLKMSSALLSRFDLVFVLLDRANSENDQRLSRHIMHSHGLQKEGVDPIFPSNATANYGLDPCLYGETGNSDDGVAQRPPVPPDVLRNYILYARKFVHPKMTGGAATVLQRLYLKIRNKARVGDSLPITTRQLESLVRLSQARARMELRGVVRESDAHDIVALMEQSLLQTFQTGPGTYDFKRRGMSQAKKVKSFVAELCRCARRRGSALFSTSDLLVTARRMCLEILDFDGFLEILNEQSYILKKAPRLWQVQAASF